MNALRAVSGWKLQESVKSDGLLRATPDSVVFYRLSRDFPNYSVPKKIIFMDQMSRDFPTQSGSRIIRSPVLLFFI